MRYQIEKDIDKIKLLIRAECRSCNLKQKIEALDVCDDCNFANARDGSYLKGYDISKSHLFYFLSHPELNFKFPDLPDQDFLGNERSGTYWRWELHHEDGNHWNDEEWNVMLVLKTEHMHLHTVGRQISDNHRNLLKKGSPGTKLRIERQLNTRRKNGTMDVGFIRSKLTRHQVAEIKYMLNQGMSTTKIAKQFGRIFL